MDMATALGSALPFTWNGASYRVLPADEGALADYTAWLKAGALRDLFALKPCLVNARGEFDQAKWREAHADVWGKITSHQYDWESEWGIASLRSLAGLKQLASLIVRDEKGRPVPATDIEAMLGDSGDSGDLGDSDDSGDHETVPSPLVALIALRLEEAAPKAKALRARKASSA
jgi:hypothetical protein